ncbi:hypothetical protein BKA82DRAFT_29527 [Pisolithus tinctorius]|uniref:Uncharacterized protein n=1 Tax=Pisolithus tinctorius Marx 270 TaxID=870435 RepID=A0A0C3JSD5_PISTI|nr:hypothetical protein BKA82DRAFT_29527 [Pisolithus tinctorius]KIO00367.1 hypothetical protein M404DRAFT_29527 [Pisolithus tinctorius Marx 270]
MSLFGENMCWTVLHDEFTAESVYPRGLLLVCRTSSVCEFVEQFPFLTSKDIKPIAEFHSGFVSSYLSVALFLVVVQTPQQHSTVWASLMPSGRPGDEGLERLYILPCAIYGI